MKEEFDYKAIGVRLKQVREELRLTIDSMREITGYAKGHISQMENGIKRASLKYLFALWSEFNINLNWLITGQGTMFKPDLELNLDFGKEDNELVKEMIFYLFNANIVKHDLLRNFIEYKRKNKDVLKEYPLKDKEAE